VRAHFTLLLSGALAALLVSGCTAEKAGTAAGSARPSSARSAPSVATTAPLAPSTAAHDTDSASGQPPFIADLKPDTATASADARVTVRAIRIGPHPGFDRVVFELGGKGTPGWDVRYVDSAVSPGSGKPVPVRGGAVLQVSVTGAGYPYDTGVTEYAGRGPLTAAGTHAVTEVVFGGTYEGTTSAFVGAAARTPFRVYRLDSPSRIVVEVAAGRLSG
jgi:hypothetical protein